MAVTPKDGKLIYHITALKNLESIFKNNLLPRGNINFDILDVADENILEKREKFKLETHTPFHFFASTPFSGSVQISFPETEFVYLCLNRHFAKNRKFKIIPNHPLQYKENPLEWGQGLEKIDWELMEQRDYSNHECKEICMAECIYEGSIPAKAFSCIFVKSSESRDKVVNLLEKYGLKVKVNLTPGMFKKI